MEEAVADFPVSARRVNDRVAGDVDSYVLRAIAAPEEQEVSCAEIPDVRCDAECSLLMRCAWQRDAEVLEHVTDESGAIACVRRRTAPQVAHTEISPRDANDV